MVSTKAVLSTAASLAASAMLVRTIANDFIPHELRVFLFSSFRHFVNRFSSLFMVIIEEFDEFSVNHIYKAAEIYLGTKISPSTQRVKVSKSTKEKSFKVTMERGEEVVDVFEGIQLKWRLACQETQKTIMHGFGNHNSTLRLEVRSFELTFHRKHKDKVMSSYFSYVLDKSKVINEEKKALKLHTVQYEGLHHGNLGDAWRSVTLDHPANFKTLAMDSDLKTALMEDLERFVTRKDFYRRVGKAWKRGYLLYGPPGTGKSSLIAAMANFLNFDVYDLELTELRCNSALKKLLLATANRSILVVEDIDCTIELQDRKEQRVVDIGHQYNRQENQVTLSGFLNFIDGLWSSCGDERIIIFTTNHKDRLDPALLRPGRMDMHIHMSYCTPCGFKILASNYLGIDDHNLFEEIQGLIQEMEVTPAQVAEILMKSDDPELALGGLVEFLRRKQSEINEEKQIEFEGQEKREKEVNDEGQEGKETEEKDVIGADSEL
ncbi:AAA-ATPase At3g50940-like [Tasmannia lanceolata]|uniref:AAA-ATPase At3g50940-like n=1 Tax=Tasmannia lanceolata TaxID=3420 RepID=UPI0040634A91